MVCTASSVTQVNDSEQKKRKQTLERAKANHLSRQLQMRLQYARLKVDHGWQKQNLNEVENLYFHHSHMRGPRPSPASVVITATHPVLLHAQAANSANTHFTQSNLSFRQHLSGARAGSGGIQDSAIPSSRSPNEDLEPSSSSTSANPPPIIDPTLTPEAASVFSTEPSQDQDPPPTPVSPQSGARKLLPPNPFDSTPSSPASPTKATKSKLKHKAKPKPNRLPSTSPSFTPHAYQHNIDSPLSDTYTTTAAANLFLETPSKSRGNSGRGNGGPNGGSSGNGRNVDEYSYQNTSLTYDSFWSSHSSSSANTVVGSMSRGGGEVA